jgi:queuine tRNA-ribosyltransferase catalytic subunit
VSKELNKHSHDVRPIEECCPCPTCSSGMSRAMLHHIVTLETAGAHGQSLNSLCSSSSWDLPYIVFTAVTQHNITFQARIMGGARDAIMNGTFPDYLRCFFTNYFGSGGYPQWCVDALKSVGVDLLRGIPNGKVVQGDGAKWEYADEH